MVAPTLMAGRRGLGRLCQAEQGEGDLMSSDRRRCQARPQASYLEGFERVGGKGAGSISGVAQEKTTLPDLAACWVR